MGFGLLNESVIYLDCWKANERLVDYKAKQHYMVKYSKSEFANEKFHINAIENVFTLLCS